MYFSPEAPYFIHDIRVPIINVLIHSLQKLNRLQKNVSGSVRQLYVIILYGKLLGNIDFIICLCRKICSKITSSLF